MQRQIEQHADKMSPAERKVAGWVLDHPRQTIEASVADVAAAIGTSEPTIIRFCRRVGLSGFRELKIRLTEDLSRPASYLHRDVTPHDGVGDAVTKVIDRSIQALIDTRTRASSMPFESAVTAMATARQIVFAGLGASAHVAGDACHKYFRLGVPCASATDSPTILQIAAVADPADVFIFVSHTGRWAETVRAATLAREREASVIALTDPESSLAAEATLTFDCRTPEDTSLYTPMSSRLAQLTVLDALQVALALRLGQSASARLRRSKDVLAPAGASPRTVAG